MKPYWNEGKNIFRPTVWLFTVKSVHASPLNVAAFRTNSFVKNMGWKFYTGGGFLLEGSGLSFAPATQNVFWAFKVSWKCNFYDKTGLTMITARGKTSVGFYFKQSKWSVYLRLIELLVISELMWLATSKQWLSGFNWCLLWSIL